MFGLFKKKTTPAPPDDGDPWTIAEGNENGLPTILRFRSRVPVGVAEESYPHLINIYWRYEPGRQKGMPGQDDYDRMRTFEDALDEVEGPNAGYMMLSITGNSRKEWIWYVKSREGFQQALNQHLRGLPVFPVELEAADDPGWDNYHRLLRSVRT